MNKIKVSHFQRYSQIRRQSKKIKLPEHTESGVYLRTDGPLYRIMPVRSRKVATTMHITFDEDSSPRASAGRENLEKEEDGNVLSRNLKMTWSVRMLTVVFTKRIEEE